MNPINKKIKKELKYIEDNGLYKKERLIFSKQSSKIIVEGNKFVLNFCANNYLGLSNHPEIITAATEGIKKYGFGLSSVRFMRSPISGGIEPESPLSCKSNLVVFFIEYSSPHKVTLGPK